MQTTEIIKSSLVFIEQNLKTDMTVKELAQMAGYSVWHYQRLFAQATGLPLATYITRRRLEHVLAEISKKRKATDVLMTYGFDSYAGFYKAFLRMYGCSPKKYLRLYGTDQSISEGLIMFTETELRKILNNWDIPQNLTIKNVKIADSTKTANNVWQIGKKYFLKTEDKVRLLRNIKVVKALAEHGFEAAVPIPTINGDDFTQGEHIFVLTCRLKGKPLTKTDRFGDCSEYFGFQYGKSIAELHRTLAEAEDDIHPFEQNLFAHVIEWAIPSLQKQNVQWNMGVSDEFFEEYRLVFENLFNKLPKQLIHRDPNPDNILFCDNKVSGFIDFELSERNIRLWDPCYCATGILSEWREVENIRDKWSVILENILRGYDSVNPLTQEEKQSIYYVLCSIQMICIAYFESISDYKDLAKTNREMLKFIIEKKDYINGIFSE